MKQLGKISLLIIMLIGLLLLTGCNKFSFSVFHASNNDNSAVNDQNEYEDNDADNEDSSLSTKKSSDYKNLSTTPTPEIVQPTANSELTVYTVDADGNIIPVTALIPEKTKITPQLIVDTVVESMADQAIVIAVKDVTTKNDTVIVNFTKENPPFKNNLGSGFEASILNAIAQSLIDNLDNYKKVIYRIDDKPYSGGDFKFGMNEVYFGDK